jgi:hypothetical protein
MKRGGKQTQLSRFFTVKTGPRAVVKTKLQLSTGVVDNYGCGAELPVPTGLGFTG